ncbi:MAG: ABC transporter ATP-binding protein, partial [Erysipelotrichaceae bacterium]|nr:ABC transporter ATP-binding protein [Erysipelotrichaceae bacterium]
MKQVKYGSIPWLILVSLFMTISVSLNGYSVYLMRYITDYGLEKRLDEMFDVAKIMIIILGVNLLINLIYTNLKSIYLNRSLNLMKRHYIDQLLEQDITQLQKDQTSKYLSNLTNDFDRYEDKYLKNVLKMVEMVLHFLMAVVLIATINVYLILIAFVLLFVFIFLSSKTSKPVQKTEKKKSESLKQYTDFVNETLNGFEIIKQHQLLKNRYDAFYKRAVAVQNDNFAVDVKTTQIDAFNSFVQTLILFGLITSGILYAKSAEVSLGSLIVIVSSFGHIMWPLQEFSPIISQMKGIQQVLNEFVINLTRPVYNRPYSVKKFEKLQFESSDLGYEEEEAILKNVNLTINYGEKVLIVGHSGAGKSTILKTIRQSIQPKNGKVLLDNINIFEIVPIDYYSLFTSVDQIGFIFNGTLKENLSLYQDLDENILLTSLRRVGLSQLSLDMKLKNNGSNVSGGQRARLMLARAICLNTDVILCDEIFANLEQSIAHDIEKDLLSLD